MTVIQHADTRRTETPGGVMTTLASPTQGGASLALWRVEVKPEISGPVHFIDAEQIWTFVSGQATVDLSGTKLTAAEGDTVILPAEALRQITAGPTGYTAVVAAPAGARAGTPDNENTILPAWIA